MKLRFRTLLTGVTALLASMTVHAANSVDMNFSNESVRGRYTQDLQSSPQGRKELGVGVLYNTDDNLLVDVWFQITDAAGSKAPGLDAGVGFKGYVGQTETQEYMALAIGGELYYRPAQSNRMIYQVGLFVAPGIVTFLDADSLWDANLRVGYEILPTAIAYISYRSIRANFDVAEDEEEIDRGAQLGLELRF